MKAADFLSSVLIPTVIFLHLWLAPYTKVEESFNIQATHDILTYGTPTTDIYNKLSSRYDHFTFSGAVPRSFVGALLLAGTSQPIIAILGSEHAQFIVRAVLALLNAGALLFFKSRVQGAFGAPAARWYAVLQASQFHSMFYASRTLPNMFAFPLTTMAFALLLPRPSHPQRMQSQIRLSISLFVFAAVIFRSEVAILLAANALWLLLIPVATLNQVIAPLGISFLASLALSVPVDSYFWQKPIWPELWGFYFNVVKGSSSEWGTSPWYYYIVSALPRLLGPVSIVLLGVAARSVAYRRVVMQLLVPNLLFVAVYSLLPHKEARFIFYVIPPLTAAAAIGAASLTTQSSKKKNDDNSTKSRRQQALAVLLPLSVLATFAISTAMLFLSSLNYPGGVALSALQHTILNKPDLLNSNVITAHADVLSCMTGITLFGTSLPSSHHHNVSLRIDRSEDRLTLASPVFWSSFDYLILESPYVTAPTHVGSADTLVTRWDVLAEVKGLAGGWKVLRPGEESSMGLWKRERGDIEVLGGFVGSVDGAGPWVARVREWTRERITRGWWIEPRLETKIRVLRKRMSEKGASPY